MPPKRLVAPAMRDVARLAKVAPITVSRALSGHPSVRPETRQTVLRAANKLGYVHNFMAGALLRRGSKLIALVVPNVSNSVFAETIHGLEEVLSVEGYTLTIGHSGYSREEEERLVRTLLGYGPDGVVLTGFAHTRMTRSLLKRAGVPIVETWNTGIKPIDMAVGFSNYDAAFQATEYLIGRGRTNLAYAGGTQRDNDRTLAREAAFRAAVAKARLMVPEELIISMPMELSSGVELARRFAKMISRPNALFAASDVIAAGFILECNRLGIRIPDDIAVVGFDDAPLAETISPGLSTVHIPQREIGRVTAGLILRRLSGEKNVPKLHDVGFRIVLRASA
ncbi:MAG TPA: LacI family DNA-binding transcriptional regulator [Bradyrhizobium sp.]|nr:LacI family DNA-binding transcriptional regulator [Bradyrhizobium sp.]